MTYLGIISSISTSRLSSYKKVFECSCEAEAINYYYWNQAISSELYVLLHTIEVCLRNKIHVALSKEVSLKVTGKIQDNYPWYTQFSFIDTSKGQDVLTETGRAFKKITHNKKGKDLRLLPQIIISRLEFGKWSYVLSAKKYGDGNHINWESLFPLIFSNFIGMDSNKHQMLIERIRVINKWRNRVAHLEPVWKFGDIKKDGKVIIPEPVNQNEVVKRFNAELRRAIDLLLWLCPDTHTHYVGTQSYKRLKELATAKNISTFSL